MFLERPEITIILLTHNRPDGLKRAIDSIYSQTFKKYEVIVLDNGSTSESPNKVMKYLTSKKNLRYIQFKENEELLGIMWNRGISLANGKFVMFMMDDDTFEKDAFNNLHQKISKNLDMVYGKVTTVDSKSKKIVRNTYSTNDWKKGTSKKIDPIHLTSVIINRDVFNNLGGFHEEMYRSYPLDFWNRIFKENKCLRIEKNISKISVNSLDSVTGKRDHDKVEAMEEYPLVGYWSERKSVSFLGDEREFINQLNSRNHPWIATHDSLETNATVTWAYTEGLDDFAGERYYYVDHPAIVQPSMVQRCDGVITQFPFTTDKPHHILRPTISHQTLLDVDRFVYLNQKNLKILCPKLNEDNLDFIYLILDHLSDRFKVIYIYFFDNLDAVYHLKQIKNVYPKILEKDDYTYFKKLSVDAVLHVEGDTNSYVDAYKDFITSAVIQAPLISSPNIAYEGILDSGVDFYQADRVQHYIQSILKTKDLEIRAELVSNARKKIHLYFLDQVVLDKFTLFLNNNHLNFVDSVNGKTIVEQLDSNSSTIIHFGEYITQSFTPKSDKFNAIQFFGTSLNNQEGYIELTVKLGETPLVRKAIPNFKLKNGLNTVLFDDIVCDPDETYTFTISGNIPVFKIDYLNSVLSVGTYFSNDLPKKSCLKFIVLRDAS